MFMFRNHRIGRMSLVALFATAAMSTAGFAQYATGYTPGYGPQPYQLAVNTVPLYQTPAAPAYQPAPVAPVYTQQPSWQTPAPLPVAVQQLDAGQLADTTAAIALFPDPLLNAVLTAATYPDQVAYARQWLAQRVTPGEAEIQALTLDGSVKTLLHYPQVLTLMADNTPWTQALSTAARYQPGDLMNAIQTWRQRAQAAGNLVNTPQQQVYATAGAIQIMPVAPQTVYVPVYDPAVVYTRRPDPARNMIQFSAPRFDLRLDWGGRDMDWHDHSIRGLEPVRATLPPPVYHGQAGPFAGRNAGHGQSPVQSGRGHGW